MMTLKTCAALVSVLLASAALAHVASPLSSITVKRPESAITSGRQEGVESALSLLATAELCFDETVQPQSCNDQLIESAATGHATP